MKALRFILVFMIFQALISCNKEEREMSVMQSDKSLKCNPEASHGSLKIAVLSDLHFMDPSLLKSDGSAFQMYLAQDPKLLEQSGAILHQIFNNLLNEKPDLLLISGDLTKDGELVSHKNLIKQLKNLERNNIKILVVPGNHDINNPDSKKFDGDNSYPVPTITADQFRSLYSDFGYGSAIATDPNSLSYVAEPVKGLWVLCLDANEYYNNTSDYCVVAGNIKDGTMAWAKEELAEAKERGKTVIGMMHHGVIEHFMGESVIFSDYLVDNWEAKADELMNAGLKVIFTGHFHANDAVERVTGANSLVDIETGSPVIYSSPYRLAVLADNKLTIKTKHVEKIYFPGLTGSFQDFEKAFTLNGVEIQAQYMLTNPPYNVPADVASGISPVFAQAMLAHLGGDETISPEAAAAIQAVYDASPDLGQILMGLFTDLPPADNSLVVNLK